MVIVSFDNLVGFWFECVLIWLDGYEVVVKVVVFIDFFRIVFVGDDNVLIVWDRISKISICLEGYMVKI